MTKKIDINLLMQHCFADFIHLKNVLIVLNKIKVNSWVNFLATKSMHRFLLFCRANPTLCIFKFYFRCLKWSSSKKYAKNYSYFVFLTIQLSKDASEYISRLNEAQSINCFASQTYLIAQQLTMSKLFWMLCCALLW